VVGSAVWIITLLLYALVQQQQVRMQLLWLIEDDALPKKILQFGLC
jgi:hypothetical protein